MAADGRADQIAVSLPATGEPLRTVSRSFHFPGWLFTYAVVLLFAFLLILEAFWVVRVTHGAASQADAVESIGWIWPWLTLTLLAWGGLNLWWGLTALRAARRSAALAHLGLCVCCGLAVILLQALGAARALTDQPLVLDYSHGGARPTAAAPAAAASSAPIAAGDPIEGKKLFAMTCVTCHGSTGDGLNNLAPSLRTSEFIKSSDVAAIARVVKGGRAINDPANKSGKMMPAKGGNPFLTDPQIGHLVAFVKSLPSSEAPAAATAGDGGPSPEQLSRWVVPPPASPPPGLLELSPELDWIDTAAWQRIASERRTAQIKALGLSAIAVHGLFLLGLVGISSHLVFGWLLRVRIPQAHGFVALVTVGWLCALVAWLVVLWLFPSG